MLLNLYLLDERQLVEAIGSNERLDGGLTPLQPSHYSGVLRDAG
jgi:hypothetical protein